MTKATDRDDRAYHLPDPQRYAANQESQRHDQALYSFGEYSMFILFWNIDDFNEGTVARCPECYVAYGKIAQAYGQPANSRCGTCYGTTFDGGFKAKIVRPSLWDFNLDDYRDGARGQVTVATSSVQSTSDFRMSSGDIIIRADGVRWMVRSVGTNHLRTGFEMPTSDRSAIGYNYGQVSREDEDSVLYEIPPLTPDAQRLLDISGSRYPQDFSALEIVRAPLTQDYEGTITSGSGP